MFERGNLTATLLRVLRIGCGMWRKIADRGHPAFHLADLGTFRRPRSHFDECRFKDRVHRAQIDRETLIVIADEELSVVTKLDAAILKILTILQAEHREQ